MKKLDVNGELVDVDARPLSRLRDGEILFDEYAAMEIRQLRDAPEPYYTKHLGYSNNPRHHR